MGRTLNDLFQHAQCFGHASADQLGVHERLHTAPLAHRTDHAVLALTVKRSFLYFKQMAQRMVTISSFVGSPPRCTARHASRAPRRW